MKQHQLHRRDCQGMFKSGVDTSTLPLSRGKSRNVTICKQIFNRIGPWMYYLCFPCIIPQDKWLLENLFWAMSIHYSEHGAAGGVVWEGEHAEIKSTLQNPPSEEVFLPNKEVSGRLHFAATELLSPHVAALHQPQTQFCPSL